MSLVENQKIDHDLMASVVSPFVKFHKSSGRNVLKQAINFSSYSNTGYQLTLYPPSSSTVIDKRMLLQSTVTVGTTVANELTNGAPRCFPLASVMSSLQISINGNSTTTCPRDLLYFLQRFNNNSLFRSKFWSMTPSQPDPCSSYNKCPKSQSTTIAAVNIPAVQVRALDGPAGAPMAAYTTVPAINIPAITTTVAVNWSPFCEDKFFKSDNETSRAAFPYVSNVANTLNTYVFTEPLLHSLCSDNEIEGLTNVREMSINITFDNNLVRLFSKPSVITNGVVQINTVAPKLLISYYEPEDASQIPLSVSLPYTQYVVKNTTLGALNNAQQTKTFSNIILGQVPSKMFIFARPSNSALTEAISDGFACIESINFTIGNRSGILASASSQQLFQMSVANGLSMNWTEYSKRIGSVLCVDVGNDIAGLQPGGLGNVSISFDISLSNKIYTDALVDDPANIYNGSFDLYFVAQLDGEYKVSQDSAQLSLGLSVSDMVEAESTEPLDVSGVESGSGLAGGSMKGWRKFYGGLKKGVRSVNRFMQKIADAPGMDSNIYLQGAAKIFDQTNNMLSGPQRPQQQMPVVTATALPKEGSGMYKGRGLLRV